MQLLDVVFRSEKRKNMLLLLKAGPMEMETILKSLKTTRQALLPQVRILEHSNLVSQQDDTYELTTIGKLIVDEMIPLLETMKVLDNDIEYWGKHNLDFIPPELLKRFYELGSCDVIEPSLADIFEINKEFCEKTKDSKSLYQITTYLHPNFSLIVSGWVQNNVDVHIIITKELLDKLQEQNNEKLKEFSKSGKVKFYLYPGELEFISFALNDYCILFRLLGEANSYDNKQLMTCNPGALEWGKHLFDYFRKDALPVADT
ncbi:winged helix-turn-helix domain-containing protein [Methanolobus sp. ZRKC2]|uniref:helix-turn-helix transcriptional regulator n=1 Tax=Methanolobus sp. ZRKC2 TaxID=3125783 RepID=UPI00324F8200